MSLTLVGVGGGGGRGVSSLLNGLVSAWEMDTSGGLLVDSHGTNTLTNNNGVTVSGGMATFNGTDQYLSCVNTTLKGYQTDFTVAFRFKFTNALPYPITTSTSGWSVTTLSSKAGRKLHWGCGGPGLTHTTALSTGTVYTVVVWYYWGSQEAGVEVNGTSQTRSDSSYGIGNTSGDVHFGGDDDEAAFLEGSISRARFWNRVLGSSERVNACYAYPQFETP